MRRLLVTTLVVVTMLSGVAQAATPKGFRKAVSYTDLSPDPSGNVNPDAATHCSGMLPPQESGIPVRLPGPGYLEVTLGGFQGDWAVQVRDTAGRVLIGGDVDPPDYESVTLRVRRATNVVIFPCNLAGTPNGKVLYTYTYRR